MNANIKTQIKTLFACAVLIIILPFTGFPDSWRTFFAVVIGLAVFWMTWSINQVANGKGSRNRIHDSITANKKNDANFVENSFASAEMSGSAVVFPSDNK